MRVISGKHKGRILFSPKGKSIRPTSDRTKEVIFNFISAAVKNSDILDLFSGTGNLAIEALSREAASAILVDKSSQAIRLIHRNLELTNFLTKSQIVQKDVFRYLKKAEKQELKFGLIFADPPYSDKIDQNLIRFIDQHDILAEGGLFILEHSARDELNIYLKKLIIKTQKKLGDTAITIFNRRGD